MTTINLNKLRNKVNNTKTRSAWANGVKDYANDIIDNLQEYNKPVTLANLEAAALNGASDWRQYAWGGCGLAYDEAIAERLCTPSELKRARGRRGYVSSMANSREAWLDVEARALYQAFIRILNAAKTM